MKWQPFRAALLGRRTAVATRTRASAVGSWMAGLAGSAIGISESAEPRRRRPPRRGRARPERAPRARRRRARHAAAAQSPPEGRARCRAAGPLPRGRPPSQRHPASLGRRADDRERADPPARFRLGRAHQGPKRQGQSDRARGVQPPRQKLPGHHDHARAAVLALEAAYAHGAQLRRRRRTRGASHLALARPVAVNDEGGAMRSARGAAPQAARGPSLRRRRHLRSPRLDVERAPRNSLRLPFSNVLGARREGWSAQRSLLRVTLL